MEKYRDRGIKLTPQRIAIFDFLEGNKNHPSAEEIYRAVSRKFPTMSFATVYNTLATLHSQGRVRELSIEPGKKRYDPDTSQHHHFICDNCRRVVDIEKTFDLELPSRYKNEFVVLDNRVEFHGFCPSCRQRGKK